LAADVMAMVDGLELPSEKEMENFESFFSEYFGKR
jgi:hypothetical protein